MTIADLATEARLLCDADSNDYSNDNLRRRINQAYEEVVGKLIAQNNRWEFDDSNYTAFPIGQTTLVDDQEDYTLDTTHLIVERVQVLDSAGVWRLLTPIDRQAIKIPFEEYLKDKGMPIYYDKTGSSLILKPAPNTTLVTATNGLRVYFQRTASVFTSAEFTTGTKSPGFSVPYHVLLAYKAALPFCMAYKPDRVPLIRSEIQRLEGELFTFESNKEKDERKRMSMQSVSFR